MSGSACFARRQVAEVAVQLVVGVLADGAGVEHHDVGVGAVGGPLVSRRLQQSGQPLGVVHVHLAAVGADLIGASRQLGDDGVSRASCVTIEVTRTMVRTGPDDAKFARIPQIPASWALPG